MKEGRLKKRIPLEGLGIHIGKLYPSPCERGSAENTTINKSIEDTWLPERGVLKMFFVRFESALCSVYIFLISGAVDVESERKGCVTLYEITAYPLSQRL